MKTNYLRDNALALCTALLLAGAIAIALGSCFFDTKTTLCEATGLRCRPGQTCAADQAACISAGGCGDGIRSGSEVCDDGNVNDGDGCSRDCISDETCGNGITDAVNDESCDGESTCSNECKFQICGNFQVDRDEKCDDGNDEDGDGCSSDCLSIEVCGNGIQDFGEQCEFPIVTFPTRPTDSATCDGDCSLRQCGDSYVSTALDQNNERIEDCDLGGADKANCNGNKNANGQGNCKFPRCGDGYVNSFFKPAGPNSNIERCDGGGNTDTCNGNDHDHNGVDDTLENNVSDKNCQPSACGDGYMNPRTEQCDNGTNNSDTRSNACRLDCSTPHCGDHVIDTGETCDDDNNSNTDGCPNGPGGTCKTAVCGDGFIRVNVEECDIGNGNPDTCNPGKTCNSCRCI